MPDAPTRENQSLIIKNLNNIFVSLVVIAVGGLFTWGVNLSRTINEQKDQYDQTIVGLRGEINALQNEVNDDEKDIQDLQAKTESEHDDTRIRLTKLEDWEGFLNSKSK